MKKYIMPLIVMMLLPLSVSAFTWNVINYNGTDTSDTGAWVAGASTCTLNDFGYGADFVFINSTGSTCGTIYNFYNNFTGVNMGDYNTNSYTYEIDADICTNNASNNGLAQLYVYGSADAVNIYYRATNADLIDTNTNYLCDATEITGSGCTGRHLYTITNHNSTHAELFVDNVHCGYPLNIDSTENRIGLYGLLPTVSNIFEKIYHIRASNTSVLSSCTVDANCTYSTDMFCNTQTNLCQFNNVNISLTNVVGRKIELSTETSISSYSEVWRGINTTSLTNFTQYSPAIPSLVTDDYNIVPRSNYYYQVIIYNNTKITGKSNKTNITYEECSSDFDCVTVYGDSYSCYNNECVTPLCSSDSECGTGYYCNLFTQWPYMYGSCVALDNPGDSCLFNNQCNNSICVNSTSQNHFCNWAQEEDNPGYNIQYCGTGSCIYNASMSFYGTCWNTGVCYNASLLCTHDANCTASQYCSVWTEGQNATDAVCKTKLESPWDSCARNSWCGSTSFGGSLIGMDCTTNLCTPTSWECNYDGYGCNASQYCNWSSNTDFGDHKCYTFTNGGGNCTQNSQCSGGKCLAGVCTYSYANCAYNNPDKFGRANGDKQLNGYCASDPLNTTTQWCYIDNLTYTTGLYEGDKYQCVWKLESGQYCDYNYQCISLNCGPGGGSKICLDPLIPSTQGGYTLNISLSGCTVRDSVTYCAQNSDITINAAYENDGIRVRGGTCVMSSVGFLENSITMDSSYYGQATIRNSTGSFTYNVKCQIGNNTNTAVQKSGQFTIAGSNETKIVWTTPINNETKTYLPGGTARFDFTYNTLGNALISDATCTLEVRGVTYATKYSNQRYFNSSIMIPSVAGTFYYSATCSKSGYESATATGKFWVLADHCTNNLFEPSYGELGKDCGGSCPLCPGNVDNCDNDKKDVGEVGKDCGGICPNACPGDTGNCLNGEIDTGELGNDCGGVCPNECCDSLPNNPVNCGTCTDGMLNGNETQIDEGGRCEASTWCGTNNDCVNNRSYLPQGSYTCVGYNNTQFGVCTPSICTVDANCSSISWENPEGSTIFLVRDRACNIARGLCAFGNGSGNYTIGISVSPLSNLPIYNNTFFVGNCEDGTNGVKIVTDLPTKKQYNTLYTSYLPSITGSSKLYTLGSGNYELQTSGVIPIICPFSSQTLVYSKLQFKASNGTIFDYATINFVTLREKFRVNVSQSAGSILNFTANRYAYCYWGEKSTDDKVNFANGTNMALDLSASSLKMAYYVCNTTYGEEVTGKYSNQGWDLLWSASVSILSGIIGKEFKWYAWMIVPVAFIVFIILPLVIVVMYSSKKEG